MLIVEEEEVNQYGSPVLGVDHLLGNIREISNNVK